MDYDGHRRWLHPMDRHLERYGTVTLRRFDDSNRNSSCSPRQFQRYAYSSIRWVRLLTMNFRPADIVKMIDSQPDLAQVIRRVRGGYLKIQGTWMPYEVGNGVSVPCRTVV